MADATRRKPAGKLPITSHPLFPVIVVLWVGALFGLASLAIRPALIEGFVAATGIDHVIPQAAPPLGTTTRILIALLMTGIGCLAGLLIARRFAAPVPQSSTRRRHTGGTTDSVSPISLFGAGRDESEDQNEDESAPLRRRQLAILPDEDDFDDHAPLPGSKQILSVTELDLKSFDEEQETWLRSTERRHVPSEGIVEDEPVHAWIEEPADDDAFGDAFDDDEPAREPTTSLDAFQQVAREMHARNEPDLGDHKRSNRLFETYVRRVNAGVGSNDSDGVPTPGFVSLPPLDAQVVEPAEPAWQPEMVEGETSFTNEAMAPAEMDEAPVDDEPEASPYANTAHRIATAPLDQLSHVELLERLGQTIARRRAEWTVAAERKAAEEAEAEARAAAAAAEAPPAAPPEIDRFEVPAAMRPHWIEPAAGDEDDALPGYVPPRHMSLKPVPAATDEDILAQGYSSLLGMTKPTARTEFMRGDAVDMADAPPPPVYAFPGLKEAASADPSTQEAPAPRAFDAPRAIGETPDATEQALRAALATLQRMSGAA